MPGHLLSDTEDGDHDQAIRRATHRLQRRQRRQKDQEETGGCGTNHDSDSDNERTRASAFGQKSRRERSHTRTRRSEKSSTRSDEKPFPRPAEQPSFQSSTDLPRPQPSNDRESPQDNCSTQDKANLPSSDVPSDGYVTKMRSWLQILRVQLEHLGEPFEQAVQPFKNILYLLIITFFDALTLVVKTCSMVHRVLDALVPRIVVHIILVTVFALMMVLACISVLAAYAVDKYCSAVSTFTWVPSQFTEICVMTAPPGTQYKLRSDVSTGDTLEGWHPIVPSLYEFLGEALDSVEEDLDTALADIGAYRSDLLTGHFKDDYRDGISLCKALEFEFMKQQRALWTNMDLYIRGFPTDRPRQHWIWDRLGFVNNQLIKEAQELNKQLTNLLENGRTQSLTFSKKIPHHKLNAAFGKLFSQDADNFRAQVDNALQVMPLTIHDTDNLFASKTIWSISSDAIFDLLAGRGEMLKYDIRWLRATLEALKEDQLTLQYGRPDKHALEAKANEVVERAWEFSHQWRARLKGYFAEGNM
ncbi:hypothetical protein MRS44_009426 [Fusarium solani]|uniref:Uncharacterized protein n=1 Tax=Fusarium solani TaxID=169388 RepID=A0A9P9JSC7_FUSSL|nr:uncharacterized protein B0J15DRAFT_516886 [Fusarium solani]KAH7235123.1 hypothetical protein B0J15DRAFT_516886 [Fusarium solani]KAJ3464640.1 hypothetical protein MRS44_009426 [Fusarium solani]